MINRNTPYTKEELIELLQAKAQELGRPPSKDESFFHRSVRKHFGSWNKGLEAAGLQVRHKIGITKQDVLDDIERVAQLLGHQPKYMEYRELGRHTNLTKYGGWLEITGQKRIGPQPISLKTKKPKRQASTAKRPWKRSREDFVLALQKLVSELGYIPLTHEFQIKSKHSLLTMKKLFSGYDELIVAAGFEIPPRKGGWKRISKEQLLSEFIGLSKQLGRTPTGSEFYKFYGVTTSTIKRFFGSYNTMVREAGLEVTKNHDWSPDSIIEAAKRFFSEYGRPPTDSDLQNGYLPHRSTIKRFFKSLKEVRQLAQIPEPIRIPKNLQLLANDGHIVESFGELEVDNFLSYHQVAHEVQVEVCDTRRWTCDFVVNGNLWIEVDGFWNGREFLDNGIGKSQHQFNEKIDFYRSNSYNFLIVKSYDKNWTVHLLEFLTKNNVL